MGRGDREDSNQNRRQITLHSFRRFVKTTISDLGYFDFSEYFIGHIGSTYWRKKDSEKAEIALVIEGIRNASVKMYAPSPIKTNGNTLSAIRRSCAARKLRFTR
jgi:hypothetical protein